MTEQEIQDFLKKVKDKKIRWCTWRKAKYFIPNGIYEYKLKTFYGISYTEVDSYEDWFHLANGFNDDGAGKFWSFYEPLESIKSIELKCTCGAKFTSFPDKHLDWCDLIQGS